MSKGIVTEYPEICIFCGRQAEAEHHLIFGTAGRELSERDGLKIPVCNNCHNMGQKLCRIHENPMAERLSKMLGQAIWEKEWITANSQQEPRKAREGKMKLNDIVMASTQEIRKIIFIGGESMGAILMLLFLLYVGYRK